MSGEKDDIDIWLECRAEKLLRVNKAGDWEKRLGTDCDLETHFDQTENVCLKYVDLEESVISSKQDDLENILYGLYSVENGISGREDGNYSSVFIWGE